MKQVLIFSVLIISTLGDKLNQYLPPRPENDNIQFQPPVLPNSAAKNQPFTSPGQHQQQFSTPNSQQASNDFSTHQAPEQSGQASSSFSQSTKNSGQSSIPFGQTTSFNGNGNPGRQYLGPNKPDTSGQSSNTVGQFQNLNSGSSGYNQGFNSNSKNQEPFAQKSNSFGQQLSNSFNQKPGLNGQYGQSEQTSNGFGHQGQFNGQFSGIQGNFGSQSTPIGLIRSEFNPDLGDGHYSYVYETENGITAQEEGFIQNEGKSAQGGFSYTSPEGEHISLEYTADENGFIPKGSHVPQIPEAILKSIEVNKAAEARGEYNEGSDREKDSNENGYQGNKNYRGGNGPNEQSPFASQENKQVASINSFQGPKSFNNNGYSYSGPTKFNNFVDQGTFASQDNKQVTPYNSFEEPNASGKNGYKYSGLTKSNNFADQGTFASQNNKQVTPFDKQQEPISQSGQEHNGNNGYQNSAPAKNFPNRGIVPSQEINQITPFGHQEHKSSFGEHNNGYNGYSGSAKTNFADQRTLASQQNNKISPFGARQGPEAPFGQQDNGPKSLGQQNNGYQYPAPVETLFATQQNKEVIPVGGSSQFASRLQYGVPEQASSATQNNNQFSPSGSFQGVKSHFPSSSGNNGLNHQPSVASGQVGTIQDNQGGYKY